MSFVKKGGRLRPKEPITRALTSNNVRIAFILPKFLGLHFTNFSLTLDGQPLVSLDLPHSLAHSSAFLGGSVGGASTLQRVCREPGLQAASDCRLFAGGGGGTPWDWSKMAEFYLPPPRNGAPAPARRSPLLPRTCHHLPKNQHRHHLAKNSRSHSEQPLLAIGLVAR